MSDCVTGDAREWVEEIRQPARAVVPAPGRSRMTAREVADALRRRHPALDEWGRPSQWTCLTEWAGVDLLAINAWRAAPAAVAYEIKVSRGDMRRELLKPYKRARAVRETAEFWFAVPAGMLTADELAFAEPGWEAGDFERGPCTEPDRQRYRRGACREVVPEPAVLTDARGGPLDGWALDRAYDRSRIDVPGWQTIDCRVCNGRGWVERSLVEREAPTLWVPRDCGLIEVHDSGTARVAKKAPRTKPDGILNNSTVRGLARWASARPDPRHTARADVERDNDGRVG